MFLNQPSSVFMPGTDRMVWTAGARLRVAGTASWEGGEGKASRGEPILGGALMRG